MTMLAKLHDPKPPVATSPSAFCLSMLFSTTTSGRSTA